MRRRRRATIDARRARDRQSIEHWRVPIAVTTTTTTTPPWRRGG